MSKNEKNNLLIKHKQNLGQYFTTNIELKSKVYEFIKNEPLIILEPSIGQGDLVEYVLEKTEKVEFDMYEIDKNINMLDRIQKDKINFGDFMEEKINKKYKTIIGNPPFVRTKKGNLYIDFTEKCYNLLEEDGELVFIVPSDFLKLTCASKLLDKMMNDGTFTHIYHPNNEKMFEGASIDVIVFRYYKNKNALKTVLYNEKKQYIINNNGLITFSDKLPEKDNKLFKDYFDIYVGMVSAKEEIYKNEKLGNITLLTGKNKYEKYIFTETYPSKNEEINKYLLENKTSLINRKIRKFDENNWYEWGAPRNISAIKENMGRECIYLYNLTRKQEVSFKGNVNYFGGGFIMLIPKDVYNLNLDKIVEYMNMDVFKKNFIFSGRFKIGHRQISNMYIDKSFLDIK